MLIGKRIGGKENGKNKEKYPVESWSFNYNRYG